MTKISPQGDGSEVIIEQPTDCPACELSLPAWGADKSDLIWWQEPTDVPGRFKMMYYHRACGLEVLAREETIICWAGCQRRIAPGDAVFVDPDGDGDYSYMHEFCAGARTGLLFELRDMLGADPQE